MLSIFTALAATARTVLVPRADLLLENAALRHQLDVLQRHTRHPQLRRADRVLSDLALSPLVPLEVRARDRQARDRAAVAPGRLPPLLALAFEGEARPPAHRSSPHRVHPAHLV